MRQSPLLSLSLELILLICDELEPDDLRHLRLTCKSLAEGLAFLVLHRINISAREGITLSQLISDLRILGQPNNAAACYTREISVGFFWTSDRDPNIVDEESDDERQLRDALLKAMISLKGVDTVRWHSSLLMGDPKLLQKIIWDAILSFGPRLHDLTIDTDTLSVPLDNIESLIELESISILAMPVGGSASVLSAASKLCFSSSNLESITIRNEFSAPILLPACSIHIPSGPPSLYNLNLTNCFIPFDEPTALSRLSNLTSLTYSLTHSDSDSKYSPDKMWTALKLSGIQLEELDLGESTMTASLIDYLSTFSGLRILRLNLTYFTSPPGAVAQFWSASFPNHVDTLEEFALYAYDKPEWCFYPHHRSLIAQCTSLEYLSLCISYRAADDPTVKDMILDAKAAIDMAVTDIPCIEHLNLRVAGPSGPRGGEGTICKWIPTYDPPASCANLPWLSVGEFRQRSNFLTLFGTRNCNMKLSYEEVETSEE